MQRHIECDVAVVGGGAAGIAAAIGASRAGARTVLIERNHILVDKLQIHKLLLIVVFSQEAKIMIKLYKELVEKF